MAHRKGRGSEHKVQSGFGVLDAFQVPSQGRQIVLQIGVAGVMARRPFLRPICHPIRDSLCDTVVPTDADNPNTVEHPVDPGKTDEPHLLGRGLDPESRPRLVPQRRDVIDISGDAAKPRFLATRGDGAVDQVFAKSIKIRCAGQKLAKMRRPASIDERQQNKILIATTTRIDREIGEGGMVVPIANPGALARAILAVAE